MPSIRKSLLQLVFSGSFMKRWNDKLRPMELFEVDKQAHKMMIAWLLCMENSRELGEDERLRLADRLVEGGLFDYFFRLVITDIKPPVFYQIKANPAHYRRLSEWVLAELTPRIQTLGEEFMGRMRAYLSVPDPQDLAGRILHASHIYASRYEFHLIKDLNPWDEELEEIEDDFTAILNAHTDLRGVPELMDETSALARFANLCGRLRFQRRWSQTPRIPETSVLGHLFIVAAFAYLFSLEIGACRGRRLNNFFTGLFHDLPELLTRDIISPVKRSVAGIGDIIREYEEKELGKRVFARLSAGGHQEIAERLKYFLGYGLEQEFGNTVRQDGDVALVSFEDLQEWYNDDRFDPRDGELVKLCDNLAAFMEAYTALRNGITSDQLQQSLWRIKGAYQKDSYKSGVHIGSLLADFD